MKFLYLVPLVILVLIVSGCATGQDPVSRLCSRTDIRGQITATECNSELLNLYTAIQNNQPANCDLLKTEPLKLACKQAVGKMTFEKFVKAYLGVDLNTLVDALAPQDCSKSSISVENVGISPDGQENVFDLTVKNNGQGEIEIDSVKVYDNTSKLVCDENTALTFDKSPLRLFKGQYKAFRLTGKCNIFCSKYPKRIDTPFEKVVVSTSCQGVIAEAGKDKLNCGNVADELETILPQR